MRTAISVDDELMIATLKDYLRKRQHDSIVEQLNQVYGSEPDAAEKRSATRLKTKFRRTVRERW